jgi:hypothetical protein
MTTANTGLALFPATPSVSATSVPLTGNVSISVRTKTNVTVSTGKVSAADLESAVYAYIQAVRALGKTKITPEEIAQALNLPVSAVEQSLSALQSKGVRVIHHG